MGETNFRPRLKDEVSLCVTYNMTDIEIDPIFYSQQQGAWEQVIKEMPDDVRLAMGWSK